MGIFFFLLGLIFLLAGIGVAAYDALYYFETDQFQLASVSQIWIIAMGQESLIEFGQSFRQQFGSNHWVDYVEPFLASPALITPFVLGLLFMLMARASRKPKIEPIQEHAALRTASQGGENRRGGGRRF
jgi:cytochrome c biogenesis protein CcdA